MKLALVRRQFSATGGAELYAHRLLGALAARGHEVHLFAESWGDPLVGVTLHPIAMSGSRSARPLRFAEAVQRELAREKFDCVFSLDRTLKQDVYRAGDGVHRVWLDRRRQFAPWWRWPLIGRGAFHRNMIALEARTLDPANTRHIIVNSEMVQREIRQCFKFPPERIHLVRNGVNVARFQSGTREETRAHFGVKDDEFLLLFVGSGWERKGLRFLLEAMNMLADPRVKLLVVGKGKKSASPPLNVIFSGAMADVENAYAAADLFVFLPIYEPAANVCTEALAAGLPVVTSAQNGASELIAEGVNGSVIQNPADIPTVVKAIRFWMARPQCRPVQTVFDLSIDRNVSETLGVIELAAREKRA